MKVIKFIIPFICILSMVGFEVVRDMSFFYDLDSNDMAVLSNMSEEDHSERESKTASNTLYELDIDFEELAHSSFFREAVWFEIICAHDLKYDRLEQKVIIPPPEFLFS
ncbi:MAG: hypothetical protein IPG07_04130 [Crocinitomicaceae bacterium]|nr:hypothetical protein [Crocinitomicaceae bacterium]MBK6951393.1 hypothetical protein [Crocinitomicaceae bacterium]